jgi:hypothetical protein
MSLVYYHPIAIANKHPFHKCVNPLISVMDRTNHQWPNFEYFNMFPMPTLADQTPDFMETSVNRIKALVDNNKHINVLWSGGIDSTFIMTLMIDLGILDQLYDNNRLTIGLNQDSIKENPNFYNKFIKPKFIDCVVQADHIVSSPKPDEIIITGEMADNLVGSLTMKSCVDHFNDFSIVHQPMQKSIDWMGRNLDAKEKAMLEEFIADQVARSPVELVTNHDLLWYLNFNFKWQAVNFRIVSHAVNEEVGNQLVSNLNHFFNTEDFQQWSMKEGHYFTGDNWGDYKKIMKKQIYSVTGDMDYFRYKTKYPSLPGLLRYKDTFDFIYSNGNGTYKFSKTPLTRM